MDPITAISFASNVISFVQFVSDLCKSTREIYGSANGCTADVMTLDCIYGRLKSLSDALTPIEFEGHSDPEKLSEGSRSPGTLDVESMDVDGLAALCKTDCDSLLEITRKLKSGSTSTSKWKSFRMALRKAWKQKAITELEQRLSKIQATITLDICKSMNKLHLRHSNSLRSLQSRSEQLHADQKAALDRILSSLSEIQAKIGSADGTTKRPFTADEVRRVEQQFSQMSLSESDIGKEQIVIKSLAFNCMPIRHEAITEAHRQTFKWALEARGHGSESHSNMSRSCALGPWLRDGGDVFWVSGKPGSGKSTFMKFVSQEPRTIELLSQWASPKAAVIIRHYFWSGGTPMQRSLHGLLQTLLYEIVRQCPRIIPTICPDQWADTDSLSKPEPWSFSALRTSFGNFIKCCGGIDSNFCFFIDGLDEHDGDHLELCNILSGLAKSANIKICLSSRPWNVFDEAFGHGIAKLYVHELTKEDIRTFTASRLREHPRWDLVIKNLEDGQWLIDQITDRAWGVFLWATLVTKLLLDGLTNRDRFSDILRRLDSFPIELETFFMKILTSVEPFYRSKMATTLLVALAAEKPLHFLIYEFHDQEYDDREYALKIPLQPLTGERLKDIRETTTCHLDSRTRGLLQLPTRGKTVTFLHRTVVDFLNKEDIKRYLNTQVDPKLEFCAQLSLLKAHLAFVKATERTVEANRIGFGLYKGYDDDWVYDEDSVSTDDDIKEIIAGHNTTFHVVTQNALAYGAIVDAESHSSWDEHLTRTLDDMEAVLALLVIEDDWNVDAYFREQLVTSKAFNYLKKKFFGDPAYLLNLGIDLAMYLVRPCCDIPNTAISEDGMVAVGRSADIFREGLAILRRAVEAHCIDLTRIEDCVETAWSRLLSLLFSPLPQRRPLLIGLLENNIFSALLAQGADRNASLEGKVAWAVFLSCSFDIPPVERIRAAYLKTLSNFLGPDVELGSRSEATAERILISEHFLDPLQKAASSGTLTPFDRYFMRSIAGVLLREAKGSACLIEDIQEVVQEVLGSDASESLSVENSYLVPMSRRKRRWKDTGIGEGVSIPEEEASKCQKTARARRSTKRS